ncbi:hypothetical protein VNO80_31665 [Phaseolus coccineus]|uniref:Uncharacterized protein n=1 Tax=Phaseolus coccineus TaxID=3886 RepID=A0AAN9L0V9_PHACN
MPRALPMPACLAPRRCPHASRPGDVRMPRALAMPACLAPWRCPHASRPGDARMPRALAMFLQEVYESSSSFSDSETTSFYIPYNYKNEIDKEINSFKGVTSRPYKENGDRLSGNGKRGDRPARTEKPATTYGDHSQGKSTSCNLICSRVKLHDHHRFKKTATETKYRTQRFAPVIPKGWKVPSAMRITPSQYSHCHENLLKCSMAITGSQAGAWGILSRSARREKRKMKYGHVASLRTWSYCSEGLSLPTCRTCSTFVLETRAPLHLRETRHRAITSRAMTIHR